MYMHFDKEVFGNNNKLMCLQQYTRILRRRFTQCCIASFVYKSLRQNNGIDKLLLENRKFCRFPKSKVLTILLKNISVKSGCFTMCLLHAHM